MALKVIDEGRWVKATDSQLKEAIWKAKQEKQPWEVIDLCVKAFENKYPRRYQSYVIRLKDVRENEKVTTVGGSRFRGVSRDKINDAYLAHTVDFPAWIMQLIRKVYPTEELEMDEEFFRTFAKRYPQYAIMERVS